MILKIKARHLLAVEQFWCDECAIGYAMKDQLKMRAFPCVGISAVFSSRHNPTYRFDSYEPRHFKKDVMKAKKSHPNKIIREIELIPY